MDLTPTGVGWKGWGQINRFTSAARFQNFRKKFPIDVSKCDYPDPINNSVMQKWFMSKL